MGRRILPLGLRLEQLPIDIDFEAITLSRIAIGIAESNIMSTTNHVLVTKSRFSVSIRE